MISPESKDLIEKLLSPDYTKRFGYNSVSEIKNHPFFNNFNWNIKNQVPFYVPNKPNLKIKESYSLKKQILNRFKNNEINSVHSFDTIIRFDALKDHTT